MPLQILLINIGRHSDLEHHIINYCSIAGCTHQLYPDRLTSTDMLQDD